MSATVNYLKQKFIEVPKKTLDFYKKLPGYVTQGRSNLIDSATDSIFADSNLAEKLHLQVSNILRKSKNVLRDEMDGQIRKYDRRILDNYTTRGMVLTKKLLHAKTPEETERYRRLKSKLEGMHEKYIDTMFSPTTPTGRLKVSPDLANEGTQNIQKIIDNIGDNLLSTVRGYSSPARNDIEDTIGLLNYPSIKGSLNAAVSATGVTDPVHAELLRKYLGPTSNRDNRQRYTEVAKAFAPHIGTAAAGIGITGALAANHANNKEKERIAQYKKQHPIKTWINETFGAK